MRVHVRAGVPACLLACVCVCVGSEAAEVICSMKSVYAWHNFHCYVPVISEQTV